MSNDKEKDETPAFSPALVRKLVHAHLLLDDDAATAGHPPTTTAALPALTPEAAAAVNELLTLFVKEALGRASLEAEIEQEASGGGVATLRSSHVTKVAAELLMDFS
jgi:hypothetical protein